ncbi:hypothetical protein J7337_007357 [Fusarium musae]|uniref:Rhodopsin domain-containing protein n=1 Tax=Fusarium musae TaxID=1042133 RepID=A0A9P8INR8_9HYPO|nr:hypothetical protein J7337_007357 [Fusarium musae]KAG9501666.1 hypothetical protein J7337_007357 [Fusarium musae]
MTALAGQIAEIWILYVIGTAMIAARIFCRTKMVGYRNYDWDDYLVIAVAGMWTAAPVIGQVFVQGAEGRHTSDLTFEERKNMSEEDSKKWAYGSQMFLLGLTGYVVILWTLKFNMLCFYSRVVRGLWTERFVKPLMMMVLVGIQTSRLKKSGLFLLFSLGFFCMFAAILRFVLIFNASPQLQSPTIAFTNTSQLNQKGVSALWSMREDCVGIFVGQAPMVTPLLKRRFWVMAGYATDKTSNSQTPHYNGSRLESHELRSGRANNSKVHDPYSITNVVSRSESQEEIVQKDLPSLPEEPRQFRSGIRVEQRIDVEAVQGTYTPPRDPRW